MAIAAEKADASSPSSDNVSVTPLTHEAYDLEANDYSSTPRPAPDNDENLLTGVLSRTLSRVRTKDSKVDPGPPPDGGTTAWLMVFLTHLVIFNTWGFINSFGLFETYYVNIMHLGSSVSPPRVESVVDGDYFLCLFVIPPLWH
jgi:hypothetical protein